MFLFHDTWRRDGGNPARAEDRLKVCHAKGLQQLVVIEQSVTGIAQRKLAIEMQPRLELLRRERASRMRTKGFAKSLELRALHCEPRGHVVSAVLLQQGRARAERRHE